MNNIDSKSGTDNAENGIGGDGTTVLIGTPNYTDTGMSCQSKSVFGKGTDLNGAMEAALRLMQRDKPVSNHVIVITDGEPTTVEGAMDPTDPLVVILAHELPHRPVRHTKCWAGDLGFRGRQREDGNRPFAPFLDDPFFMPSGSMCGEDNGHEPWEETLAKLAHGGLLGRPEGYVGLDRERLFGNLPAGFEIVMLDYSGAVDTPRPASAEPEATDTTVTTKDQS